MSGHYCDENGVGFLAHLAQNSAPFLLPHCVLRTDETWLPQWGAGLASGNRAWLGGIGFHGLFSAILQQVIIRLNACRPWAWLFRLGRARAGGSIYCGALIQVCRAGWCSWQDERRPRPFGASDCINLWISHGVAVGQPSLMESARSSM